MIPSTDQKVHVVEVIVAINKADCHISVRGIEGRKDHDVAITGIEYVTRIRNTVTVGCDS